MNYKEKAQLSKRERKDAETKNEGLFIHTQPLVVVQIIVTSWTKESRGDSGAALRNSVPEALEIPMIVKSVAEPTTLCHKLHYSERYTFQNPSTFLDVSPFVDRTFSEGVKLRLRNNILAATYSAAGEWGFPKSYANYTPTNLHNGQWARFRYNKRIGYGRWSYRKTVLNVGIFDLLQPRIFLATQPTKVHSDMVDLW